MHRRAVLCDAEEDRRGLLDVAEWRQRTAEEEAFAALLAAAARRLAVVEAECGARSTLWLEEVCWEKSHPAAGVPVTHHDLSGHVGCETVLHPILLFIRHSCPQDI